MGKSLFEQMDSFSIEGSETKSNQDSEHDIAIIGLACKLPKADDPETYWNNLTNGLECLTDFPRIRRKQVDPVVNQTGVEKIGSRYMRAAYLDRIDMFDHTFFNLSPKEARLMDPNQRIFLEVAYEAIENAGYGGNALNGSRTGVFLGYKFDEYCDYKKMILDFEPESLLSSFNGNLTAITPSRLSYMLDLRGPSLLIETACSSALVAVHQACQSIRNHESDMAVAAGLKVSLVPVETKDKLGIESSDGKSRTFDNKADGTGMGEGAVSLLLKPLKKAKEDGDYIHAVIKGSAINQDGRSIGLTAPNVLAQAEVIERAWQDAKIDPRTISYIETHGTATKMGDPIEIEGIEKAFSRYTDRKQFCAVSSIKSYLGHLDNAAGMAGLLQTVLALKHKQIPPVFNFHRPNCHISFVNSPVYVNSTLKKWDVSDGPRRCGVSSYGFSGTNCHVVLEEAPACERTNVTQEEKLRILTISAKTKGAFGKLIKNYQKFLQENETIHLDDLCYTANTGRGHYEFRLAILFNSRKELLEGIDAAQNAFTQDGKIENSKVYTGEHNIGQMVKKQHDSRTITEEESMVLGQEAEELLTSGTHMEDADLGKYQEAARLYVKGAVINWTPLYKNETFRHIPLPAYPYEEQSLWVKLPQEENKFYQRIWAEAEEEKAQKELSHVLLITNHPFKKQDWIESFGYQTEEKSYQISIHDAGDSEAVMSETELMERITSVPYEQITKIVYMTSVSSKQDAFAQKANDEVSQLLNLIKVLMQLYKGKEIQFILLSENGYQAVKTQEAVNPVNALLYGLVKSVKWECPNISCRCIDMDGQTSLKTVVSEIEAGGMHNFVTALRDNRKYYELITKPESLKSDTDLKLEADGLYVITGGSGGIGMEICRRLTQDKPANVALIARSSMPPREQWKALGFVSHEDSEVNGFIRTILDMEKNGSRIEYISADVSNQAEMTTVMSGLMARYKKLNGIFHCAGITMGDAIENETSERMNQICEPKVAGTYVMDQVTREYRPEFMMLFSSAITLMGKAGGSGYTAANTFLDSYAQYRNVSTGLHTVAINWPTWKNTGMMKEISVDESKELFHVMEPDEAVEYLMDAIPMEVSNVIAGKINEDSAAYQILDELPCRFAQSALRDDSAPLVKQAETKAQTADKEEEVVLTGRKPEEITELERKIGQIWGKCLGCQKINVYDDFYQMGGDSIIAIKIVSMLSNAGIEVEYKALYQYTTLQEFADYTAEKMKENQCIKIEGIEPFNDIYYYSCFYNAFLPVVQYYKRDVKNFILDQRYVYKVADKNNVTMPSVSYVQWKDVLKECKEQSLKAEQYENVLPDKLVDSIKEQLENHTFVIIWVDCFYLDYRADTFEKEHWAHTLLVTGVDPVSNELIVLEHTGKQKLDYEERRIESSIIIKAYEGYIKNCAEKLHMPAFITVTDEGSEYKAVTDKERIASLQSFHQNCKEEINQGIKAAVTFAKVFNHYKDSEEYIREICQVAEYFLNDIINAVKAEIYVLENMELENQKPLEDLMEIEDRWEYVRAILLKCQFTGRILKDKINIAGERLSSLEQMLYRYENDWKAGGISESESNRSS